MTGNVIKEFLVGLGFDVDDSSLKKFNDSIRSAGLRVAALYGAIKLASAAVVAGIAKVSQGFEDLGYQYRIIAPMINKTLLLRRELLKAYSAAGINITKVVKQSVLLNFSLAKTKFAFEAIYKSVASKFFPLITKQSDLLRQKIYANMPKIVAAGEKFVAFIFKALDATVSLGTRVFSILTRLWDIFKGLDDATNGWLGIILAMVAAWHLLNLEFLATPLGALIAGITALIALYDDFKVWEEGGDAFFNWSKALPVIQAFKKYLSDIVDVLGEVFQVTFAITDAFIKLFSLDFSGMINALKLGFESAANAITKAVSSFSSLLQAGKAVGNFALAAFGSGANASANIQNSGAVTGQAPPVGQNIANQQSNLQQQTQITVMGSGDANQTAKAVASQQNRVNFDLVRNMRGATR